MDKLKEAYEMLDKIKDQTDSEIIKQKSREAFELSNKCFEAAIILSKLSDNFDDRQSILINATNNQEDETIKERINIELANLYYDYGMFKKSKDILLNIKDDKHKDLVKYKIMTLLAHFEDENIEKFYSDNTDLDNNKEFIRMSFPYMFYKIKKMEIDHAKKLFKEINKRNPYLIKAILTNIEDENEDVKEAHNVFKNNAILINESPYIMKLLVDIC